MNQSSPQSRGPLGVLAAIPLAVHVLLAWSLRAAAISTGQDDAVYLLLGRGLRHLSYSSYWLVENSPHGQYPPLYPLVLAGTGAIFGDSMTPIVVLNILFSTLALGLLFSVAARWSPPAAFMALSVGAVNPLLVQLAGQLYSEPFYMCCAALTIWFLARPESSARSRSGAAALAVAAFLGRVIGIAMIAAVFLHWLKERRYRAAVTFGVASLVFVGGWFLHAQSAARTAVPGQSYILDALSTPVPTVPLPDSVAAAARVSAPAPASPATAPPLPASPEVFPPVAGATGTDSSSAPETVAPGRSGDARGLVSSLPGFLAVVWKRVLSNGPDYLTRGAPSVLAFPTLPGTTFDNWLWLVLLVGLGALGMLELGHRLPGAAIYLACYAGILLIWPYSLGRYLAPVIPLLLLLLFLGLGRLLRGRTDLRAWLLPSILALVLVVSGFNLNRRELSAMARCDRATPYASEGCFNPVQRAFFEAVWQVDREAPGDAALMSPKMATVYLLTGRRSIDELPAARLGPEQLRQHLKDRGVQYILFSRIHLDQMWLADRLQSFCGEWEVRAEYPGGALLLRRAENPTAEPARTSCESVSRFVKGPW